VERVQLGDGRRRRDFGRGLAVAEGPGLDRVVERARLVHRRDAQLAVEHPHAFAVLAERGGAVARARVEAHELAVRRLVERVDREMALRVPERRAEIAVPLRVNGEPREDLGVRASQRVGLGGLPIVELRAVAEREALEQVAAVERGRVREPAVGDGPAKLRHVDPQIGPVEIDRLALGLEPAVAERGPQDRQRATKCAPGLLLIMFWPEQRRQGRPPLWLPGHGEVGKERGRLSGVGLDGLPAHRDRGRAQQADVQLRQADLPPL